MSLARESIFAAQPGTARATPTHLSVDPKGERIAYASGKSVFLRSLDDPSAARQYTAHTAPTTVARFSPSGYYVASGDVSGTVRVWDCAGEDMVTKGEFHIISGPIKDLAWDGESKRIIAVGEGKERFGHCITFDTGNSVGEISGHSATINAVAIRAQRPFRAATASDDQTVAFFHGAPYKFDSSLRGLHSNFVQGVAFSPDGEAFVSVGADRKIFLFDGKTGALRSEIGAGEHNGGIFAVSWAPDSKAFVTASADQTVKLWRLADDGAGATCAHTWAFPGGLSDHQVGVVYTPRADGLIVSLSLSGTLHYLTPASAAPTRSVHGHAKAITALYLEGDRLLTGSYDGAVCAWDLSSGTAKTVQGETHTNAVAAFVPAENDSIFSAGWDDKLRPLSATDAAFSGAAMGTDAQPVDAARFGKQGHFALLTAAELRVYATRTPPTLAASLPLKFTPTALAADPAGAQLAVGASDNTVRRFAFAGGKLEELPALTANRGIPSALAFSPDGAFLAAGDATGKIVLYEGAAVKTTRWAFHTGRVEGIAWHADGDHVVTAGLDTNLFVYSVERPGKKAEARNAHMGGVARAGWWNGKVVSAGADGAVKVWGVVLP